MRTIYKGYEIIQGDYGLEATHPEYDGPEDRFHFVIGTKFEDVLNEIDERVEEFNEMWRNPDLFVFFGINNVFSNQND